jgi:hypothetical protein
MSSLGLRGVVQGAGRNETSRIPYLVGERGDCRAARNGTSRIPYLVSEPGRAEWDQPHSLPRRREGRLPGRAEWDQPHSLPRRRDLFSQWSHKSRRPQGGSRLRGMGDEQIKGGWFKQLPTFLWGMRIRVEQTNLLYSLECCVI